jgi:4'-phosphopantetheinyl transferase
VGASDNDSQGRRHSQSLLDLTPDSVHVWSGSQDQHPDAISGFYQILSPDEQEKASRFKYEIHRLHFIAAHGMLRRLLGNYLRVSPGQVRFLKSKYDKPFLSEEFEASRLKFNMSHSGGRVMLAFAIGRELGIDVEQIRPDFGTQEIAERFFSRSETEKLRSLPVSVQAEAFFNCWTRKEAFIKAIGEGLSCPLDRFDVTLAPGEPAMLLATRVEGQPASRWSMQSLDAPDGYKAAIVVEGQGWNLSVESWDNAR